MFKNKILWIIGILLIISTSYVSAETVSVHIDNNFIVLGLILAIIGVSLSIGIKSQGVYKSIIGVAGIGFIGLAIILDNILFKEGNTLTYASIIIIDIFLIGMILAGIGLIILGVSNIFNINKK